MAERVALNTDVEYDNDMELSEDIDGKMSFCERIKFLMKPVHSTCNDNNHKSFAVSLLPETYYLYALFYFWCYLILAIVVTLTLSTKYNPDDNPIKNRDGYNIICVWWDFAPITHYDTPLYLPFILLVVTYSILDLLRVYYSFRTDGFITQTAYTTYKACCIVYTVGFLCSINMTATDAYQTLFWHSFGYLTLIIALWITNALQIYYYYKIRLFDSYKENKCFVRLGIMYVVLMGVIILYKFIWSTTNLIAVLADIPQLHWSKLYPEILPFGRIIEFLFLVVVAVMPVPIKLWIAPQLRDKCVKLKMDYDVKFDCCLQHD